MKVWSDDNFMNQIDFECNSVFLGLAHALTPVKADDALRTRVLANATARPKHLLQTEEGEFVRVLTGVYVKQLRADGQTETGLWRLDPGAIIPAHGHKHEEECLVISGTISYAGRTLASGDFLGAAKDERQGAITTATGALLLIRGELRVG